MSKRGSFRFWQLRVKSFRTLMLPCFLEGSVMGIVPYKTSALPPYFVNSTFRHIYGTIITLLCIGCAIVTFYYLDIGDDRADGDVPEMLRHNSYCGLCVILILITYLYSTRRMKLFQNLASLYARLPKESFWKVFVYLYVKDIVGLFYLVVYLPTIYQGTAFRIMIKCFYVYTVYLSYVTDMTYMNCTWLLKHSFKHINNVLLGAKKAMAINDVYIVRMIFYERKHPLLLTEVKELRKRYNETSDILDFLNDTFSLQVMVTVIISLLEITFGIYFYLVGFIQQKEMNTSELNWYRHFVWSTLYYSIKLVLIIYACETAANEAKKTDVLVQNILVAIEDKQLRKELQLFSVQVFHRSNIFSGNIFSVDAKLLTSIVGNVTTYLIVLIQYLASQKRNPQQQQND